MVEHTPTPWHTGSTEHTELVMAFKDNSECVLAELDTDDVSMEETSANAAHIVKCVNAFPDLVKALETILNFSDSEMADGDGARNLAEQVLSRVGTSHE